MQVSAPLRPSLSTWALHGWIGETYPDSPEAPFAGEVPTALGKLAEVPAEMAKIRIKNIEVCHFHLPQNLASEFVEFVKAAGVRPYQLLIDDGDLSSVETGARALAWVLGWMETAAEAGFERVRVIAGKTAEVGALERSTVAMQTVCARAKELGIRVVFENWFPLLDTPAALLQLAASLGDDAGLCFDFGNWGGPKKYENLEQIVHLAESCHAKCGYVDGKPELQDFNKCLKIVNSAGFVGPYTIVHGEPGREWDTIEEQLEFLEAYL